MMKLRKNSTAVAMAAMLELCVPAWTLAESRGVQFTPDGKHVLVNKDVGGERWAITRNEDGTAIGNVFRSDGGDPAFIFCAPLSIPHTYDCFGADTCRSTPCAEAFTLLGRVTLPPSFFESPTEVALSIDAEEPLQAFQLRVAYPTAKGDFLGSGAAVSCTSNGGGIFTKNDGDAGTLTLSIADIRDLLFPITIRCAFGVDAAIAASDFDVTVEEVVQNSAKGDPSVLAVEVIVNP